jgi:cell division protein FtsW (lipid II flippase)
VLIFAGASFAAVALGSLILALTGLPPGSWLRNPIAWVAGLVLAAGLIVAGRSPSILRAAPSIAVLALAATFLAAPQDGVHRWIDIGPLHVTVAALVLPMALVALAFLGIATRAGLVFSAAIGALLVLQPDASQATAFLVAASLLLVRSPVSPRVRIVAVGAALLLALVAWMRPDPLQPVAEVEEIFSLAYALSPALAAGAALALAAASFAPLAIRSNAEPGRTDAALALTLYFVVTALCPAAGAFPVPLVGLGMSFPVGYWLGIALLCAKERTRSAEAET